MVALFGSVGVADYIRIQIPLMTMSNNIVINDTSKRYILHKPITTIITKYDFNKDTNAPKYQYSVNLFSNLVLMNY